MNKRTQKRAEAYAHRTATNQNGTWGIDLIRIMLEEAWLAGHKAASKGPAAKAVRDE